MRLESLGAAVMLAVVSVLPPRSSARHHLLQPSAKATAAVTNHNTLDVDVFILAGGARFRLGTVVTSQSQEFDIPAQAVNTGSVRISADPIGARVAYTSDQLSIGDGDRIRLTVSPQLTQSVVIVERGAGR